MEKIAVIYGGKSFEHDISIKSFNSFYKNIDLKNKELTTIYIDKNGQWWSSNEKVNNIIEYLKSFDVVFPLIHGNTGEDGKLQGLLEMAGVKYVGCNLISSAISMDKAFCKMLVDNIGIKQVPYIVVNKKTKVKDILKKLNFPMIVKPSNGGSSIGISVVNGKIELIKALKHAFNYDKKVVIEKYIKARELEIGVLENNGLVCSCIGEIKSNGFYDFDAKYVKDTEVVVDTHVPNNIKKEIKESARKIFSFLECRGFARVDFLYDEDNKELFFNEINTIPGFTEISMFPKLFIHDGYNYSKLIDILIKSAKN